MPMLMLLTNVLGAVARRTLCRRLADGGASTQALCEIRIVRSEACSSARAWHAGNNPQGMQAWQGNGKTTQPN
eukprot:5415133-Alexandrium_andersonii.AAC.1